MKDESVIGDHLIQGIAFIVGIQSGGPPVPFYLQKEFSI